MEHEQSPGLLVPGVGCNKTMSISPIMLQHRGLRLKKEAVYVTLSISKLHYYFYNRAESEEMSFTFRKTSFKSKFSQQIVDIIPPSRVRKQKVSNKAKILLMIQSSVQDVTWLNIIINNISSHPIMCYHALKGCI